MKIKHFTLLFFVVAFFKTQAQQGFNISGTVIDTYNKANLENANIILVRCKDSVMVSFTRSKKDGSFEFTNISTNKYFIHASYPNFANFKDSIFLDKNIEQFKINVITKAKLLESVEVQQKIAAIRLKGDTVEYKADSFKVGVNANVQELLRKLPGISVNNKGEITAQGQEVKKILVDGEEFFSDDPAVVSQSLSADAIDKVQVFDKKSDQAAFTGIDDGVKEKTINLQLKENKKKGYFGKLEMGNEFNRYRYGKALGNIFNGKKKYAAYITNDNTKYESLNWNEQKNYGEDLNRNTNSIDDGNNNSWSDEGNFSWGQGLPTSTTAGAHYSNKWKEDKHNINNSYQFNHLNVTGTELNYSKNIINDNNVIESNSSETFNNTRFRHRLRSTYEWTIDTTSSLKTVITGSNIQSKNESYSFGTSKNLKKEAINNTQKSFLNNSINNSILGTIFWRKRFKKKGRTISIATDVNYNNNNSDGYLFAKNNFIKTSKFEDIDQQKINDDERLSITTKAVYTEPLSKKSFLEVSYKFNNNQNNASKLTFASTGLSTAYNIKVDSLSNHFIFNNTSHLGALNYKFQGKKIGYGLGVVFGTVNFKLDDVDTRKNSSLNFANILPSANFYYNPKKQTRFNFSYNLSNKNPTITQIQPFINNLNQLNFTVGNENLKQEFSHNFSASFSKYQILKSTNIWISSNFSLINNAITTSNFYDTINGRNINQFINVNGNYNFYLYGMYGFDFSKSHYLNINVNPRINRFKNFINGNENTTNSKSIRFGINTSYNGDKILNYWFSTTAAYNYSNSSLSNISNIYWQYTYYLELNFKFKKIKTYFDINSNGTLYQKTGQFENAVDVYIVGLSLTKSIDKDEKFQAKVLVNDLFNTNADVNRNIFSNFITQTTRQNIQRFFMFSLIYNFSKNGKPSAGW